MANENDDDGIGDNSVAHSALERTSASPQHSPRSRMSLIWDDAGPVDDDIDGDALPVDEREDRNAGPRESPVSEVELDDILAELEHLPPDNVHHRGGDRAFSPITNGSDDDGDLDDSNSGDESI